MALSEFPWKLSVKIEEIQWVEIVNARANLKENVLVVKLDRPWNSLPDPLKEKLFEAADKLMANKHRRLKPGCTPSFVPPE